ncbi:MAG: SIMPL domain-containing protein, partial [Candidatus Marinimicrobia bacterium]|nr:SIMPL domain-containing protein [Candidatus Neomarinimicrobiota bacterium]
GLAAQNARARANRIIESTDLKIKKMISAKSGVFQITERYSTRVAGYGIHNTSSRNKTIKVTVRAQFKVK